MCLCAPPSIHKAGTVAGATQARDLAVLLLDSGPLAPVHLVVEGQLLVHRNAPGGEEGQARESGVCRVDPTRVHHQIWVALHRGVLKSMTRDRFETNQTQYTYTVHVICT